LTKAAFNERKLLDGKLKLSLKKKLIKTLLLIIALYEAETWALKKVDIQNLEAFEMWLWRKMLHMKRTDKITHQRVLQHAK